jgi:sulfide:quinone oxidoreductase
MGVSRPLVCIVGASVAGVEALLWAGQALGDRAELRLIAPESEFRYRSMSSESLFRPTHEHGLAIADLVAEAGASWVADRVDAVHQPERQLLTRDGDTYDFDYLLIALGAQSKRAVSGGYVWERGHDPGFLDRTIAEVAAGQVRSVAVVVPRGARWPIPAYELSLVLAWTAAGTGVRIALVTAEEHPLGALGPEATEAVSRELDAAGVETISGVELFDEPRPDDQPVRPTDLVLLPEDPDARTGSLTGRPTDPARLRLGEGSPVHYDRLISLPTMEGPFLAGVAEDAAGFIEVDEGLKVCGSERVWAAGGCVAAALEHSALGARQADSAIAAIVAAITGAPSAHPQAPTGTPELTGILLTGHRDQWLAENPPGTQEPSTRCLWWPPGRAVGRMLAQRIAAWDPSLQYALPAHPSGLLIRLPVALDCNHTPSVTAGDEVTPEVRAARQRDIENRQLLAVKRRERAANVQIRAMNTELHTLAEHQQEAIRELKQHGYLTHHPPV